MIRFDTRSIEKVAARIKQAATWIPFFRRLDIFPAQKEWFFTKGVDSDTGGRSLKASTIRARRRGWGYYRRPRTRGVSGVRPYLVWTGNTLDHTTQRKGRVRIRTKTMTIQHNLIRKVTDYWGIQFLEKKIAPVAEEYLQRAFDGKRDRAKYRV